jgi:hypothetical protein
MLKIVVFQTMVVSDWRSEMQKEDLQNFKENGNINSNQSSSSF